MGTQAPNTHFHGALLPFSPIPQNNPTRTSPRAHKNNPTIPQAHSPTSPQKKPTSPQNKSSPAPQELEQYLKGSRDVAASLVRTSSPGAGFTKREMAPLNEDQLYDSPSFFRFLCLYEIAFLLRDFNHKIFSWFS